MSRSRRLPWSAFFAVGFVVLGSFPLFPAPTPAWAIDAPLGKYAYIAFLVILGVGLVVAELLADAARDRDQTGRDELAEKRYEQQRVENLASTAELKAEFGYQFASFRADMEAKDALILGGAPPNSPEVVRLTDSARSSAATIAGIVTMSGVGTVTVNDSKTPLFMPSVSSKGKPPA